MELRFVKKSVIVGLLAGVLGVGSVACQKAAIRKLPATSPLRKPGVEKVDAVKTAIEQVAKNAATMRDASMKEAVNSITNALRALDTKINRLRKRTVRKRRKKHAKAAEAKGGRKTPAERQAARAARKEARAAAK